MEHEVPVAGAIVRIAANEDPLVVEADPAGDATRCVKNIARFVFRHVQDLRWHGHEGAVTVEVAGEGGASPPLAPNLACLLGPLLETAIVELRDDATTRRLLGAAPGSTKISPRDRVWVVGPDELDAGAFDLVLAPIDDPAESRADLLLVLVREASDPSLGRAMASEATDLAVVFVDASSPDHPVSASVIG